MRPSALTIFFFLNLFLHKPIAAQTFNEILGRPTDKSVTLSALFDQVVQVYFEYGTIPGVYSHQTAIFNSLPQIPIVTDLSELLPDTRYFYRTVYKTQNQSAYYYGPQRSFHTQRAAGSSFTFTIEADEHLYDIKGVPDLYKICLDNQSKDNPDFMFSLGDTFGDDHTPETTSSEDMKALHLYYREYLGRICHSAPFFFCLGNHEGESGYWLNQTPPNNIAVYGTNWRKFYYPNPYPNAFYSGNTTQEAYGIGFPENYYAFTWGDALFVVLDVYRDCDVNDKPQKWDWTLGEQQYFWLKNVLETSTATHKFVFAHHNRGQGRGGILPARGYEWGGYGNNGNGAWEFDQMRPGWPMPIHQLMASNGVRIFFQGHDHLYALETMDGVVYQEVPMPSDSSYSLGMVANADAYSDLTLDGSGHLRVRVEPTCVTVDYIAAYLPQDTLGIHKNREVRYSYKIGPCATPAHEALSTGNILFEITPNPAVGYLNVRAKQEINSECRAELFGLQGKCLLSLSLRPDTERNQIPLDNIPAGIYLLRIQGSGLLEHQKVIIAK
jgi:hypothetical protein